MFYSLSVRSVLSPIFTQVQEPWVFLAGKLNMQKIYQEEQRLWISLNSSQTYVYFITVSISQSMVKKSLVLMRSFQVVSKIKTTSLKNEVVTLVSLSSFVSTTWSFSINTWFAILQQIEGRRPYETPNLGINQICEGVKQLYCTHQNSFL